MHHRPASIADMVARIGTTALHVDDKGLRWPCTILDAKVSWNEPRYLITPVGGTGERWVAYYSLHTPHTGA